jgi:hypothetical protein
MREVAKGSILHAARGPNFGCRSTGGFIQPKREARRTSEIVTSACGRSALLSRGVRTVPRPCVRDASAATCGTQPERRGLRAGQRLRFLRTATRPGALTAEARGQARRVRPAPARTYLRPSSLRGCWPQESCFEIRCECQTRCCRTSAVRLTDARTLSSISGMRDTSTP